MIFIRQDTATIMDGMVVRYECGDFEISASRKGVMISGNSYRMHRQEDFDIVREYLFRAFRQYLRLSQGSVVYSNDVEPLPESAFDALPAALPAEDPLKKGGEENGKGK